MDAKTNAVTGAALKRAIETRDGRALTNFYTEDAVLRIVDRNNPPSRPREVKGKGAIRHFLGRYLQPRDDSQGRDECR